MFKKIVLFLLIIMIVGTCACAELPAEVSDKPESTFSETVSIDGDHLLVVHYIDVGQGDCELIEFPDGKLMLIDAGEYGQATKVIRYITKLGYQKIDYIVASHPHSDHIGSLRQIIETFDVGTVYMPDVASDTPTYTKLVETILQKKIPTVIAKNDVSIETNGEYTIEFLGPVVIQEDLNNDSAVVMIGYGDKKFLFAADAGEYEEMTLTTNIDCDVLKVGHHGSYASSSKTFLLKTTPQIGIISCAKVNDYGHPHTAALNRLMKAGVTIYGTYEYGTIVITCNGKDLSIKTEKRKDGETISQPTGEAQDYVLNTSSKKIHLPECENIGTISEKNRKDVHCTLEELYDAGYSDCQACRPGEQ